MPCSIAIHNVCFRKKILLQFRVINQWKPSEHLNKQQNFNGNKILNNIYVMIGQVHILELFKVSIKGISSISISIQLDPQQFYTAWVCVTNKCIKQLYTKIKSPVIFMDKERDKCTELKHVQFVFGRCQTIFLKIHVDL